MSGRCTYCNWTPHLLSVHEELCSTGRHPARIAGLLSSGRCRACHQEYQRKHDAQHRERNRARFRRWYAQQRANQTPRPEHGVRHR